MKYFLKIMTEKEYLDSKTNEYQKYFKEFLNFIESSRLYLVSALSEEELNYCIENFFYNKSEYKIIPEEIYLKIIKDQESKICLCNSKKDFIKKYQLDEWII